MSLNFDPSYALEFDFGRGQIRMANASERLIIPCDALLALCQSASEDAVRDFGRRLGTEAGRKMNDRLGEAWQASIETVLEHLGGELALMGLGSLGLERWGQALVLSFTGSPLGWAGDLLLGSVLEGAMQRSFGRETVAIRLMRDDQQVRFLMAGHSGARKAGTWLAEGVPWGDVLSRLATRGAS
ncbi:MAG TPA: hypothetical protein VFK05_39615 [Polyangiaceae bacterium]|nr:hypothetical protein [Polyangiaceae bacterium]